MPHKYKRFRCITSEMREKVKKKQRNPSLLFRNIYILVCVCVCVSLFLSIMICCCVFFWFCLFFRIFFIFFLSSVLLRWVCITTSLWLHRMDDSNLVYKDGNINASRTRSTQTRTVITTVSSFFFLFSFSSSFLDWSDGWCRAHLRMNRMNEKWRREVEARTK